ncbi:hypothetical protein M0811_04399 [Anaeramoeba ignava]|uniref:Uncharacterized protein n=1 Tax=Anaeramoeba ignava TaxID=1746090 RepID=A0A9Q0RH31_ANAIG|nr:hypothetical protein M0811_04399 [Anaeramoeba ignava]
MVSQIVQIAQVLLLIFTGFFISEFQLHHKLKVLIIKHSLKFIYNPVSFIVIFIIVIVYFIFIFSPLYWLTNLEKKRYQKNMEEYQKKLNNLKI